MLLPIGHSQSGVRRLPWVSFAVMGICFLAAIALHSSSGPSDSGGESFWEALEYYLQHPYLEPPGPFKEALESIEDTTTYEVIQETLPGMTPRPDDPAELRAQQEELDRLVEEALGAMGLGPFYRWGLIAGKPSPLTWLTHMFIHAGWLHLLGNLFIFYLAGPFIEDVWGRPIFAGFYLIAGIVAALTHVLRYSDSMVPLVGASGAIAGVMGAFVIRYWDTRIRFFYFFGLVFRGTFDAPAWVMLPLWFVQQVFMAMLTDTTGSDGVAYWAHAGGFAFGVVAALGMRHWRIEERFVHSVIDAKVNRTVVDNSEVDEALDAHARGSTAEALRSLNRIVTGQPGNQDAVLAYWSVACEAGETAAAAPAVARLVEHELRAGRTEAALAHWSELCDRLDRPPAQPEMLVRLAQAMARDNRRQDAAVMLRRAILESGTRMSSGLAMMVARVAQEIEPSVAAAAARLLLARGDAEPPERAFAERLLAKLKAPALGRPA